MSGGAGEGEGEARGRGSGETVASIEGSGGLWERCFFLHGEVKVGAAASVLKTLRRACRGRQRKLLAEVASAFGESELCVLRSQAESADKVPVSATERGVARTTGVARHL